jgi:CBS domain-containing protein
MKVKDIMTANPRICTPQTTLAEAAQLMWEGDCGMLPVVGDANRLVGVVTDRDLFMALGTRNARASELTVGAVATQKPATSTPDADIQAALSTMKEARVRRLPIVADGGTVTGVLSMNDVVLEAGTSQGRGRDAVIETLQAICAHQQYPATRAVGA